MCATELTDSDGRDLPNIFAFIEQESEVRATCFIIFVDITTETKAATNPFVYEFKLHDVDNFDP